MTISARWRDRLGQLVQHRDEPGLALRLGLLEDVEDRHQVRGIPPRRDVAHDPVGHAGQPDRVALLERQVPDGPGDPPGVLDLGHARRAEVHRAAGIQHQAAAQVGIGLELLDEEPVRAAVGPPVQPPQIVARDILAIFGELDARAAVRAGMPARDRAQHRPRAKSGKPASRDRTPISRKLRGSAVGEHHRWSFVIGPWCACKVRHHRVRLAAASTAHR